MASAITLRARQTSGFGITVDLAMEALKLY